MLTRLFAALLLAATALSTARAQDPAPRVIEIDPIDVTGRRQAPAAFYVLHRAALGYEVRDLRASFVRRIVQSVRRAPM